MQTTTVTTLSALSDALTIHAFEAMRGAALRAGTSLPLVNAFAAYKCAVDLALQSSEVAATGDVVATERLVGWGAAKLADMRAELVKLSAGVEQ